MGQPNKDPLLFYTSTYIPQEQQLKQWAYEYVGVDDLKALRILKVAKRLGR